MTVRGSMQPETTWQSLPLARIPKDLIAPRDCETPGTFQPGKAPTRWTHTKDKRRRTQFVLVEMDFEKICFWRQRDRLKLGKYSWIINGVEISISDPESFNQWDHHQQCFIIWRAPSLHYKIATQRRHVAFLSGFKKPRSFRLVEIRRPCDNPVALAKKECVIGGGPYRGRTRDNLFGFDRSLCQFDAKVVVDTLGNTELRTIIAPKSKIKHYCDEEQYSGSDEKYKRLTKQALQHSSCWSCTRELQAHRWRDMELQTNKGYRN